MNNAYIDIKPTTKTDLFRDSESSKNRLLQACSDDISDGSNME